MKNNLKRILSWVLVISMVFQNLPLYAFAEGDIVEGSNEIIETVVEENATEDTEDTEVEAVVEDVEEQTETTKTLPEAVVTKLDALTVKGDKYIIWPSGDGSVDRPVDIVVQFEAKDTAEEALAGGYSKWLTDFYLTISDLEGDSITADKCYLAGEYGDIGWVVIPTDGLVLKNGVEYPVVSAYDASLNYNDIVTSVKKFTAAIHIDQAILDANPDMKVTLKLKMTNPEDANDVLTIGEPLVYTAEDLKNTTGSEGGEGGSETSGPVVDVNEKITVDDAFKSAVSEALSDAFTDVKNAGKELTVSVEEKTETSVTYEIKADGYDVGEGLEMSLPVASDVAEGEKAYVVHKHGDKQLIVYAGTVEGGNVSFTNKAGFSTFTVTTGNGLTAALNEAKTMTGDVVVEIYDKVTLNQSLSGSYDSITFVGKDTDAEIYLDVQGYITATGKKVAFKDLTLSKSVGAFINNAGFMNVAFGIYDVTEVTYTNCTFDNGAYASSGKVTFTECTFEKSHEKYGLWAYGNVDAVVDECEFVEDRGIKMYAEGAAKTVDLTVTNTDFSALTGKPAIVLTYGESVTLAGNTYSSTGTFELDLDGAPNGTPVTSDVAPTCKNDNGACGVLVDGKIYTTVAQAAAVAEDGDKVTLLYSTTETAEFAEGVDLTLANGVVADNVTVATPAVTGLSGEGTEASPYLINNLEELKWFQEKVDELAQDGSTQFAGKYFKLTDDIDLAGINWNPIGTMSGDHGSFKGVFDGDNHTISNLNVQQAGNGLGLFARTAGNAVIKNLKLHNVTVKSTDNSNYVGGVVGNSYASTKIENVHVTGNIDISGRGYIGGISGHGYVVMDNVSVVGTGTISSTFWCAGGILGYAGEGATNIMNAHVEGITITSAAGGLGAIVGMAEDNNGTQPISGSNLSAKDVEIKTYTGAYGDAYADYALGYLYGGNDTSILTGNLSVENVKVETSTGETPTIVDAVAEIDGKVYFDLASAVNAGGEVKILRDIALTETLTIPAGKTVTLDLNGKTVSMEDASGAGCYMIKNYGTLTVKDSSEAKTGKLTFNSTTPDNSYGYATSTIGNGGNLVVESGTIENTTVGGASYAIDGIWHTEEVSVTINGGTIKAVKIAVRQVPFSATAKNVLNINGGTLTGEFAGVQTHHTSADAKLTEVNITGGTFNGTYAYYTAYNGENAHVATDINISGGIFNGYLYLYNGIASDKAEDFDVEITGGTFNNGVWIYTIDTNENEVSIPAIKGGTFKYEPGAEYVAEGFVPVDNGDGTYGVKYYPAIFVDANRNGVLDDGEAGYSNLDDLFANHKSGDVYVVLTDDVATDNQVDTDADAKYFFTTNVTEGVTMDFNYSDNWNYIQKASIGENITVNARYLLAWTDLEIYGTVNTGYAYTFGADVLVAEGAQLNVTTDDETVQVKDGATLTVNGTLNAGTINVWKNDAKLVVSGANAEVTANWIDIWDGTPSVTVENGATLTTAAIKASRGGSIAVDGATLDADSIELGHNGNSIGTLTVTNNGTVKGETKLTAVGSTFAGPEGLTVTTTVADHVVVYLDGVYKVIETPELPTATVTTIANPKLSFALNFKADTVTDEQLAYYGTWFADYVLTVNKDITFNANGGADGYLSGQYDAWSENWVNVPFEDVTIKAGEPLRIMEYASKLMGKPGLKYTYADVYGFVKDFDCGVYFTPEFLEENSDLEVTLELRMFNPADESDSHAIGEPYEFEVPVMPTATVEEIENEDLTFALNFKADTVTDEQLAYYGTWFADYVLTVNKDITFNANGGADGYLSGQYDAWSENWVSVPFEDVTVKAGEPLRIMEYASKLMGKPGLKYTYADVYGFVKDFDCGVYLAPEFLAENPDFKVTLELKMFHPVEEETVSYTIGKTYEFEVSDIYVAQNANTHALYEDLNAALTAARANGDTVKLIADVADLPADFLSVPYGVTLDLNGRYVKAGTVVSYGSVIDTATTDADGDGKVAGGIIISNDTTKAFTLLQPDNAYEEDAYIPIYDTTHKDGGCYRFYKGYIKHRGLQDNGDRKVIGFTPRFDDNPEAYYVLRDTSNPELKISLNLGWTVNGNAKTFDYTVGDTYLNDWAKLAAGQVEKDGEVKALVTVTVTGHSKVAADGEVTFDSKGIFTSTTRAVVESPVVSYSHNAAE